MSTSPSAPRTIPDILRGLEDCAAHGARFVARDGKATLHPYRDIVQRAKAAAGALQARGLLPGDRVAIVLNTSIEFFDAFLGVQLAGGIPAAVYPPLRFGKLEEYFTRTRRMLGKIGARFLVTDARIGAILGPAAEGVPSLEAIVDAADPGRPGAWTQVETRPADPAFLQFSSGTTLEPKAVVVTHASLLANLSMIDSFFGGLSPAEVAQGGVCWLPLYHDMGLLGNLFIGLYHPGTVTYITPDHFIARPAIWLQTLSRFRGVISAAPDFAYGLCTAKIADRELEGVDLSSWRIAFNGAEPISAASLEGFARRFARWGLRPEALTPVYGLAEAGLAVSFSAPGAPPRVSEFDERALSARGQAMAGSGRPIVSVGRAVPGLDIAIRDAGGQALEDDRVGRITVRGPSITPGYFGDAELSARTIRNGWLDTGDLGFVHAGELYVSGRAKDLIIIRGRNLAPAQVEEPLRDIEGLRAGCCVAVGCAGEDGHGEQLVILAERARAKPRPDAEIVAEIRHRILAALALLPARVVLLAPGTLPRTSSGKLRRAEAARLLLAGALRPPSRLGALRLAREWGRSRLAWMRSRLRRTAPPPLDGETDRA